MGLTRDRAAGRESVRMYHKHVTARAMHHPLGGREQKGREPMTMV
jgi:hypothetical protein